MTLNSGKALCRSTQNLLCFRLLCKHVKLTINNTIILPVVPHGCESWSLTLGEKQTES
jgi:hypothetical protein